MCMASFNDTFLRSSLCSKSGGRVLATCSGSGTWASAPRHAFFLRRFILATGAQVKASACSSRSSPSERASNADLHAIMNASPVGSDALPADRSLLKNRNLNISAAVGHRSQLANNSSSWSPWSSTPGCSSASATGGEMKRRSNSSSRPRTL